MKNGKLTYDELLGEKNRIELRLRNLERAMKEADRHRVIFHAQDWISMPIKPAQYDAIADAVEAKLQYDGRKQIGNERHYEEIHETDILPEFRHLLVRYSTDLEGNHLDKIQIWGLIPY